MKQELKSSKLQMKVTNPASAVAIHRLINNVDPGISEGQLTSVVHAITALTGDTVQNVVIAVSQEVALGK